MTLSHYLNKISNGLLVIVALLFSLFHIFTGLTGSLETYLQRITHFFLALILLFAIETVRQKKPLYKYVSFTLVIASVVLAIGTYVKYDYLTGTRIPYASPLDNLEMFIAILGIFILLEATRRASGFFLSLLCVLFIAYVFLGPYLPGIFNYGGTTLQLLLDGAFFTTDGIFGTPLGASATFVALFVIFGAFMKESGIGDLIMDVSNGILGRFRGGPAKGAVVSAGAFGSIDGNATADVMVTGSINIPLMKRVGYKPEFAGGVESAAAAGGVFLPPVMGTVAFLVADFTGVPYSQIMIYALIPAFLYYVGVFSMVHFESARLGLRSLKKEELPNWKKTFKEKWHLLIPIVVLVFLIINHYSISLSVSVSILSIVLIANFRKETRMGFSKIYNALIDGAKGAIVVTMATGVAGLMIYIFSVTGFGLRFANDLVALSNGILFLALLLTMIATILLGMGVPPSAAYLIQVAITIPPIITILEASNYSGNSLVAAHMFVMFLAGMAVITPPVALAAFSAAGIAQSDPMRTGLIASKLGIAGFIIPFMFVYNPAFLTMGPWYEVVMAIGTGLLCIVGIAAFFIGYFIVKLSLVERFLFLIGSVLVMIPNTILNAIGLIIFIIASVLQFIKRRKNVAIEINVGS